MNGESGWDRSDLVKMVANVRNNVRPAIDMEEPRHNYTELNDVPKYYLCTRVLAARISKCVGKGYCEIEAARQIKWARVVRIYSGNSASSF